MWMRIDDQLHAHRKTRAVTKSHATKLRDAAPMGLWVLAGSWAAQNNRAGWIPRDELDRWDDEAHPLALRLVHAGYWWPEQRAGEDGFGFNDWEEWNNPDGASVSGAFGNHVRWHVNKSLVKPGCEHCPTEPDDRPESHPTRPEDRPDIAPDSGTGIAPESLRDHRPDSLTQAQSQAHTQPKPETPSSDKSDQGASHSSSAKDETPERFDEFWETYSKKVGRKKAETAYRNALKRPGVTADLLEASAAAYITDLIARGKHPEFTKDPTTWLHGEHWRDERPERQAPRTRVQEHLALVQQLAAEEDQPTIPQIGTRR